MTPNTNANTRRGSSPCLRTNDEKLEARAWLNPACNATATALPNTTWPNHPRASHTPDIAALVDHDTDEAGTISHDAIEVLRHFVADLISEGNTRLTVECLAVALGLSAYNGESMTDIAKRHGVTRAAVSKRCVDITTQLNLPPSRAMRSEKARKTYRQSQLKRNRTDNP